MTAQFEKSGKLNGNKLVAIFPRKLMSKNVATSIPPQKSISLTFEGSINVPFSWFSECSYGAIFKMCRLEFLFQVLLFSKSVGGPNVPFLCKQEAYQSCRASFNILAWGGGWNCPHSPFFRFVVLLFKQ